MTADVIFPIVLGALFLVVSTFAFIGDKWESHPITGLICLAISGYLFWCAHDNTKPEVQAEKRAETERKAKQDRDAATPHVIREADGCKVYAFKAGDRQHYFTRCPDSKTSTDTSYEVCTGSGKTRSCHEEHSTIEEAK